MPFVEVWVDPGPVDMSDIETEAMEKELEKRGYRIVPITDPDDIGRVNHFLNLHLFDHAREEALRIVERQLDRPHALHAH